MTTIDKIQVQWNPDLLTIINKYKNNKSKLELLYKTYSENNSLRKANDWINKNTLYRWLLLISEIVSLQLLIWRPIYVPWLWIYEVLKWYQMLNFRKSFFKEYYKKVNNETLINLLDNWKIDLKKLKESKLQWWYKDDWIKRTFLQNTITKIQYINYKIVTLNDINTQDKFVKLQEDKYLWENIDTFFYVFEKNKNIFKNYIKYIDLDWIIFNIEIIKDILIFIWFLESKNSKSC